MEWNTWRDVCLYKKSQMILNFPLGDASDQQPFHHHERKGQPTSPFLWVTLVKTFFSSMCFLEVIIFGSYLGSFT